MFARRSPAFASAVLMLLSLSVLRADVTLRYKTEIKPNPGLSAQMTQGFNGAAQETVLRLKGGKGFSTATGFNQILDFTTKEITVLDTAGKRYAKLPYDQFVSEL